MTSSSATNPHTSMKDNYEMSIDWISDILLEIGEKIGLKIAPEEDSQEEETFEEVLRIVKESLRGQISKEHLEELFSYNVSNEKHLIARAVPLFLKNIAMKYVYTISALANTMTVSNIGNIKVGEEYASYIEDFHAFISVSKGQDLKGTICSYKDTLVFTFSSILQDVSVQRGFFRLLQKEGIDIRIESNGVYYGEM